MQLRGKQRLALLVAVVAVLVGGVALIAPRTAHKQAAPAASNGSNIGGGTTATADEVQKLKSWALDSAELPIGTKLFVGEEYRNYAAAAGNQEVEKKLADKGRIDGYLQQWSQDTAHLQIADQMDLYNSPSSAMAIISQPVSSDATFQIKDLPDPKLGNFSRMYGFASAAPGSQSLQGWVVQWVRGRTVFEVRGYGPPGELQSDLLLNMSRTIDGRAGKAPIR